jgi:diguanylate cyclase (GGDEF)-like protein/PAS domain S-box-containing protein
MLHQPTSAFLTQDDVDVIERVIARVVFAPDGTILRVNRRFLTMFDYEGWDLVGRNRSIFMPASDGRGTDDAAREAFATGTAFAGDIRQVMRDGTPFWVEALYQPVRDPDGSVREIVVLMRDATDRMLRAADESGQIAAINTSQAVIHFAMDGTILDANPLFLRTMGYTLSDLVGRHHRLFVDPAEVAAPGYDAFWAKLGNGEPASGEFRRLGRDGEPVWLRATYSPIFDMDGRPFKIVKHAIDVTAEKQRHADFQGQVAAIDKSQCVVTFSPDGTILDANRNFLDAMGYRFEEIEGRHHRLFVEPAHAHSLDYDIFWSDLANGRHRSGEFRRLGKDGREIWLQAIYSPVLDQDGRPFKIVKYATAITREKLRQADHQGQIAAIHKSQCVVSFALDGTVIDANDNFLELTGYRLSAVRGQHHAMFVAEADRADPGYAAFWSDLAAGQYKGGEFKRICRDGREIWLQASYNPIFDMNGRPFKVVKTAVDVTAQKLRQGDYEGQVAAIHKSQCVVSFALDGTILDANDNFLVSMGYELSEVVGRHHSMFVDAETARGDQYDRFWSDLRDGVFLSSKFRRVGKDGREVHIQASYNPIFDLNGAPFKIVKIATDITRDVALAVDLSRAQQEVHHDALTGLPNRAGLARFLHGTAAGDRQELALLYLDLDHFKPINDTFGHEVGDHVLKEVAVRLRDELGEGQIAARIGGDEFVVAALGLSRQGAAELAQRLIGSVSRPIAMGDRSLEVGLSIGIALMPDDTLEEEELFRQADIALYRSKGAQRGTFTFHSETSDVSVEAERHLAEDMRIAIKTEQFGFTCVARYADVDAPPVAIDLHPEWRHPWQGCLGADRFVRVAEQSGLIIPLGDWMLRQACRLAQEWPGTIVSVPVYPAQLQSSDVPSAVMLALRETGLKPQFLELRVERGIARIDAMSLHSDFAKLRSIGVTVVADGLLLGDKVTGARKIWPVDRIVIDPRTRAILDRQSHPAIEDMRRIEATDAATDETAAAGAARAFHLDPDGALGSFLTVGPVPIEAVAALLAASVIA